MRNSNNQAIGIDRTFNLGNYYVTTLVYKNQRVVRIESTKTNKHDNQDLPAQPIFLGPVLLHKHATYKTYKSFLEHIKTELESDIEAVELRLPESIEFGTDDEKALTKAIDNVFPSSIRVLCTKHLKDNVKHYLQKVSNGAKIRNRYNQVPHLTQDTNGKVTNSQKTPQTRAKRSALSQQVTTKHI